MSMPLRPSSTSLMIIPCVLLTLLCSLASSTTSSRYIWESPGCHRVGHSRMVSIPGCVPIRVTLNACRGYCLSYTIPSPLATLSANPKHIITSKAECCAIEDTEDVTHTVWCRTGYERKVFKSATSCSCSVCRRES